MTILQGGDKEVTVVQGTSHLAHSPSDEHEKKGNSPQQQAALVHLTCCVSQMEGPAIKILRNFLPLPFVLAGPISSVESALVTRCT